MQLSQNTTLPHFTQLYLITAMYFIILTYILLHITGRMTDCGKSIFTDDIHQLLNINFMTMCACLMKSSKGNIFHVTGPLCRQCTGHWWIPFTKPSDAELWCFFDLCLNKQMSKQPRRRWFKTTSHLWVILMCKCNQRWIWHFSVSQLYDVTGQPMLLCSNFRILD